MILQLLPKFSLAVAVFGVFWAAQPLSTGGQPKILVMSVPIGISFAPMRGHHHKPAKTVAPVAPIKLALSRF